MVSPLVSSGTDPSDPRRAALVSIDRDNRQAVLVELYLAPSHTAHVVRDQFLEVFARAFRGAQDGPADPVAVSNHYMRCRLTPAEIDSLLDADRGPGSVGSTTTVYRVWPDYVVRAHIDHSRVTVTADAAWRTYQAGGSGVVWAVIDSGIDATHPHFAAPPGEACGTLDDPVVADLHHDFTDGSTDGTGALVDDLGHGTHVAGIIAGFAPEDPAQVVVVANQPTTDDLPCWAVRSLDPRFPLRSIAPHARLVSLKVLGPEGTTLSSTVIAALDHIRGINADALDLVIHGVNLSLGCDWYPDDFAAGQSPLCRELDLLVGTGVVAVVSAGNSGAGGALRGAGDDVFGRLSTITDPGNAARAVTVGSTHRSRPHTYGVTYTSSKGPTLDGRVKPDLIAPGERITSAATGRNRDGITPFASVDPTLVGCYIEESGTSMAAPHVSGAIAAFLSVREEFKGRPDDVKQRFIATATTLDRHPFFQGAGVVDLMAAFEKN